MPEIRNTRPTVKGTNVSHLVTVKPRTGLSERNKTHVNRIMMMPRAVNVDPKMRLSRELSMK